MINLYAYAKDTISNCLSNGQHYQLTYLIENSWSIKQDGLNITHNLPDKIKARVSISPFGIRHQIVHFGSENIFFGKNYCHFPHASNKTVLTWFHVLPHDGERLKQLCQVQDRISYIHTASSLTKKQLENAGITGNKIIKIPLGVDTDLFHPVDNEEKKQLREKYGLPAGRLIIGSFQKDGVGWDEGMQPKLIKGPDIFVDVMKKLKKYHPFVFLTGPARGYMKKRLTQEGIEFKHQYLVSFEDMSQLYQTLDLYLVTSRIEGGPKAILESMATGVPIVSTRVGQAPDIIHDFNNGLLAQVENVNQLAHQGELLINNMALREKLIKNGIDSAAQFSQLKIAEVYYQKIYSLLL